MAVSRGPHPKTGKRDLLAGGGGGVAFGGGDPIRGGKKTMTPGADATAFVGANTTFAQPWARRRRRGRSFYQGLRGPRPAKLQGGPGVGGGPVSIPPHPKPLLGPGGMASRRMRAGLATPDTAGNWEHNNSQKPRCRGGGGAGPPIWGRKLPGPNSLSWPTGFWAHLRKNNVGPQLCDCFWAGEISVIRHHRPKNPCTKKNTKLHSKMPHRGGVHACQKGCSCLTNNSNSGGQPEKTAGFANSTFSVLPRPGRRHRTGLACHKGKGTKFYEVGLPVRDPGMNMDCRPEPAMAFPGGGTACGGGNPQQQREEGKVVRLGCGANPSTCQGGPPGADPQPSGDTGIWMGPAMQAGAT